MYQFHEPLLLVLGIDDSLPFGVRTPNVFSAARAPLRRRLPATWASYIAVVKRPPVSETFECFAPSSLMRGCKQDAIDIENARGQPFRMVGTEVSLARGWS